MYLYIERDKEIYRNIAMCREKETCTSPDVKNTFIDINVCMYKYIYMYIHVNIYVYVYIYIYVYM